MNYYRRYVGDYLRDTSRLSMLEHGAYNLLLDYYYADEKPLPLDRQELYTMVRAMRPEDRKAVDKVLAQFFTEQPDGYHQKRVDHEIDVSQKARDNGKGGGRPRTGSGTGSQTGNETGLKTGHITGEGGGSVHPPAASRQPPASYPPTAAAANHQGDGSGELSTAPHGNGGAAAAELIYPEKLTHAERDEVSKRLSAHPKAQLFLDELAGVMGTKGARNPMGLLDSFVKRDAKGEFSTSHAHRIQAERELARSREELAATGRTSSGERASA